MNCYYIIGLRVDHRHANALNLQKTLTEYGCNIKLRVGLHETGEDFCSDDGVSRPAGTRPPSTRWRRPSTPWRASAPR